MNGDHVVDTGDIRTDLGTVDTDMGEGMPDTDMGSETDTEINPLPRMEPFGPGDKEAAFWNREADAIEEWAETVEGGPDGYLSDFRQRMGWKISSEGTPDTETVTPDANGISDQSSDDTRPTGHHKPGTTPENSPEYPPCPETEPISIPPEQETPGFSEGEGGPPQPPEGWTPGRPESGW